MLIFDWLSTGEDSLDKILEGEWVAWKEYSEVFYPNDFYNFCLPQLPKNILTNKEVLPLQQSKSIDGNDKDIDMKNGNHGNDHDKDTDTDTDTDNNNNNNRKNNNENDNI